MPCQSSIPPFEKRAKDVSPRPEQAKKLVIRRGRLIVSVMADMERLRIDLFSDVICPWCYLGKKRLEAAILSKDWPVDIHVIHQPFELNPDTPAGGVNRKEYLYEKYGDRIEEADVRLREMGKDAGIEFNFDSAERIPNTKDAHRLIYFAATRGLQSKAADSLFRAYFTDGRDVGNVDVLADIAAECGLDRAEALQFLKSEEAVEEVRSIEAQARNLGITGVPFFILDGRLGVSGAQSEETFVRAIEAALDPNHPSARAD